MITTAITLPDQQVPKVNPELIPPLERRLLGGTFYAAMVRFYENPENVRRFEAWQKEQAKKEAQV